MPRNELSAQAAAELAALEGIINREPVGEEHLELAALVDSVRADAPQMTAEFSARLEESVRSRRVRAEQLRRLPRARVAFAGGSLAAAVAAVAIVASSGLLSPKTSATERLMDRTPSAAHNTFAKHPTLQPSTATAGGAGAAAPVGSTATTAPAGAMFTASGAAQSGFAANTLEGLNASGRLVARNSALTLSATPARMQTVADEVVATTEHLGGIVESSSVDVHGMASYATFSLSVPSGRLSALIGQLSSLSGVRALEQNTTDITSSYKDAAARLADEQAERTALIKTLAQATTLTQTQTIQQQITALDGVIATSEHHVGALLQQGHNATVSVNIVAVAAGASSGSGSGPISRALSDALRVLDIALAVALVALAVMLPFALCGLAVWWGAASLRQRSRERAIEASAAG